jgi:hypothetical protein
MRTMKWTWNVCTSANLVPLPPIGDQIRPHHRKLSIHRLKPQICIIWIWDDYISGCASTTGMWIKPCTHFAGAVLLTAGSSDISVVGRCGAVAMECCKSRALVGYAIFGKFIIPNSVFYNRRFSSIFRRLPYDDSSPVRKWTVLSRQICHI